jgi:hypothetical protein
MAMKAKVFEKDGNRFLMPGLWFDEDHIEEGAKTEFDILCDALMYSCVLGLKEEPGWLEIKIGENGEGDIPNRPVRLVGPQFAHGAVDVFVISGPLFDSPEAAS